MKERAMFKVDFDSPAMKALFVDGYEQPEVQEGLAQAARDISESIDADILAQVAQEQLGFYQQEKAAFDAPGLKPIGGKDTR